jgi:hypothetical protein
VVGAFFSTILHAALANVFIGAWAVPPFTFAFNFITLIFLVGALNFANGRLGGLVAPGDAQVTKGEVSTALRSTVDAATTNNVEGVVNAIMRGISQLFFANSVVAGSSSSWASPWLRGSRRSSPSWGSTVGMLTGLALGANGVAIYNGLWGFNSFDAALAIGGVFFVLTWRSGLLAGRVRGARALLFGAIASGLHSRGPARLSPCRSSFATPGRSCCLKGTSNEAHPRGSRGHHNAREHPRPPRGRALEPEWDGTRCASPVSPNRHATGREKAPRGP